MRSESDPELRPALRGANQHSATSPTSRRAPAWRGASAAAPTSSQNRSAPGRRRLLRPHRRQSGSGRRPLQRTDAAVLLHSESRLLSQHPVRVDPSPAPRSRNSSSLSTRPRVPRAITRAASAWSGRSTSTSSSPPPTSRAAACICRGSSNANTPIDGVYPYGDTQVRLLTETTGFSRTHHARREPQRQLQEAVPVRLLRPSYGKDRRRGACPRIPTT